MSSPDPSPATNVSPGAKQRFGRPNFLRSAHPVLTFVAFVVLFSAFAIWLGPKFVNVNARLLDVHQNSSIYLLALAVMVSLLAGQVDLSVASMATLSSFAVLQLSNTGIPMVVVIILVVIIGGLGGLLNAFIVVRLRVNSFIATIATGGIFDGISLVTSNGTQVLPGSKTPLPHWFSGAGSLGDFNAHFPIVASWIVVAIIFLLLVRSLVRRRPASMARGRWYAICAGIVVVVLVILFLPLQLVLVVQAISWTTAVLLVVAAILWIVLEYTVSGRYMYAIGDNAAAARLAGVNVERTTTKAFVLSGFLAAGAGVILVANQGIASPEDATGFLLPAFAAAFLSTSLFSSGRFNVWGAVVGGIFIEWVAQALIAGGLQFTWNDIVNGVVLVLAVAFSTTIRRFIRR